MQLQVHPDHLAIVPYRVDVVDCATVSATFRSIIERTRLPVQQPGADGEA